MSDTLTDIRKECQGGSRHSLEYERRMLHRVPDAPSVDRVQYIVDACRGKTVLHCGCLGQGSPVDLHGELLKAAYEAYGIDRDCGPGVNVAVDFDDVPDRMPGRRWGIDLVLVPELLEHLTNPGRFLRSLHIYHCPILITVPNAFSAIGARHIARGVENVHREHVAYYSYWTLHRLVTQTGYVVEDFCWCHGEPRTAEGLLVIARGSDE